MYVKRLNNQFCPVALLQRCILAADIDLNSSLALFRPMSFYKSTNTYKLCGNKLSGILARCRELSKVYLKDLGGYDSTLYGLHSLRAGGAGQLWFIVATVSRKD